MSWAKLDDDFDMHPKTVRAGNAAAGLFARCLAYSSKHLLDGYVPEEIARLLERPDSGLVERLVAAGGESDAVGFFRPVPGGYMIHNFLRRNPSAKEVKRQRKLTRQRVAAYRGRNAVTSEKDTRYPGTGRDGESSNRPEASRTVRVRARKSETLWPDDFALTPALEVYGRKHGCAEPALAFEHAKNKALAAGRQQKDWPAFMRAWFNNHGRYGCPCQKRHRRVEELPGMSRKAPSGTRGPLANYDGAGAVAPRSAALVSGIGKAMP